jgi:hypothetical protein
MKIWLLAVEMKIIRHKYGKIGCRAGENLPVDGSTEHGLAI